MKVQLDEEIAKIRGEYQNAHRETIQAREKEEEILKMLRETCEKQSHRLIAEASFEKEQITSTSKSPLRVCEICGTSEEAYSFRILTAKRFRTVSREEAYKLKEPLGDIEY